jgi:Polyketide cyclase / dehydrase and lipid transport
VTSITREATTGRAQRTRAHAGGLISGLDDPDRYYRFDDITSTPLSMDAECRRFESATRVGGRYGTTSMIQVFSPLTRVSSSTVIEASVDAVWELLKNFGNISNWHPDVREARIESGGTGRKPGDIRSIRLQDGTPVREQLLAISDASKSYTYSVIEAPFPIRNHRSTLSLSATPDDRTAITWMAEFAVDVGVDAAAIAAGVRKGVIETGFDGLKVALRDGERRGG